MIYMIAAIFPVHHCFTTIAGLPKLSWQPQGFFDLRLYV